MNRETERQVWDRAGERCEYCHMPQAYHEHRHHVDHIIAKQHEGGDEAGNLALACYRCNGYKGPNIAGVDPVTGNVSPLFHPQRDVWGDHFAVLGNGVIIGKTAVGRVTVAVLRMNHSHSVKLRQALLSANVSFD